MKNIISITLLLVFCSASLFSQVAVTSDGTAPHSSAMMHVKSSARGLLPPRLTHVEMNAVPDPADGLLVYCTDCGSNGLGALCMFTAGEWFALASNCAIPAAPVSGLHMAAATQVTWNWNAVAGAIGYKWGTTNVYASATDMGTTLTKTETGLTCNTAYTRYAWAYNACGNSTPVTLTQTTSACAASCGTSLTINHVAGAIAPVSKTVIYGTVTNIPGETTKCWITSNLGADHQATAVDDITEASAGWYWQFNHKQGYKHDGTTRTPNTTWTTYYIDDSDWLPGNDPCALELGGTWRIPTYTEWFNVDDAGGWSNWNGPWASAFKLHAAGQLVSWDGSLGNRGYQGAYYTSNQYSSQTGYNFGFNPNSAQVGAGNNKASGWSLRCIK